MHKRNPKRRVTTNNLGNVREDVTGYKKILGNSSTLRVNAIQCMDEMNEALYVKIQRFEHCE